MSLQDGVDVLTDVASAAASASGADLDAAVLAVLGPGLGATACAVLTASGQVRASWGVAVGGDPPAPGTPAGAGGADGISVAGISVDGILVDGPARRVGAALPDAWLQAGVDVLATAPVEAGTWLAVGWARAAEGSEGDGGVQVVTAAAAVLGLARARTAAEEDLRDLAQRVDNAQELAQMGDYDWHIVSDTNRWSDQLYRIYGHEPQAFNASYERFVGMLHPDDRDRIQQIHQQAYATGEPYQMVERIVRPDGEVRYLASNGQVVMDDAGTPVRMRGTCIDITPMVEAERATERIAARFRDLVESAPDAIMVLDDAGGIEQTNHRAHELLGGDPVGHRLTELLADGSGYRTPAHGQPWIGDGVPAHGVDGTALELDVRAAALDGEDGGRIAVFLHDARPRLEQEALAARVREAQVRRRQALEINDNVVQGLSAAAYALQRGDATGSAEHVDATLAAARRMMHDLLEPLDGTELRAGDLVRTAPATEGPVPGTRPPAPSAADGGGTPALRVLVVDDSADIRLLITSLLDDAPGVEVVGEAGDGVQAIEVAEALRPDLVLLDLAMPRMDGLEALPRIRAVAPGVRVVVLSGFDVGQVEQRALAAGADAYVEKGRALSDLLEVLGQVVSGPPRPPG